MGDGQQIDGGETIGVGRGGPQDATNKGTLESLIQDGRINDRICILTEISRQQG